MFEYIYSVVIGFPGKKAMLVFLLRGLFLETQLVKNKSAEQFG